MPRHTRPLLAALIALATTLPAAAANSDKAIEKAKAALGAAPAGFEWAVYRNVALPRPAGWNESRTPEAYVLSPEAITAGQPLAHSLRLTVSSGYQAANQMAPSQGLLKLVNSTLHGRLAKDIPYYVKEATAPRLIYSMRYRTLALGEPPVFTHIRMIADDKADTLTVFTYQTQERYWDEHWAKFGSAMLEKAVIAPTLSAAP